MCNRSEEREKQYADRRIKGTVGKSGKNAPTKPSTNEDNPKTSQTDFIPCVVIRIRTAHQGENCEDVPFTKLLTYIGISTRPQLSLFALANIPIDLFLTKPRWL